LKPSGNLLGRAALGQLRPHGLPQPGIQEFAGSPWLMGSGGRLDLRRTGAIGVASRAVAAQLAAHGAGARPNTFAIVRNDWPWVRPRLKVSRSASLKCV
jgi:hypothetical protein